MLGERHRHKERRNRREKENHHLSTCIPNACKYHCWTKTKNRIQERNPGFSHVQQESHYLSPAHRAALQEAGITSTTRCLNPATPKWEEHAEPPGPSPQLGSFSCSGMQLIRTYSETHLRLSRPSSYSEIGESSLGNVDKTCLILKLCEQGKTSRNYTYF